MFTVYSKDHCPYCQMAESSLKARAQEYKVLKLGVDYTKEELLEKVPGAKSVPQIFKGDIYIGDSKQLLVWLANNVD